MNLHYRHDTLYGRPNGREPVAHPTPLALDRKTPSPKSAFKRAKASEASYAKTLRRVARHVADIVREFADGTIEAAALAQAALERYSRALDPWAQAVATRMVAEVAQRDEVAWKRASADIGRALRQEIQTAPTGVAMREALQRQVHYITSLPIDAANRVHEETMKGISEGKRADEIAKVIMETGSVTRSRADLIAITEVARTSATLTEVRAKSIGSSHYRWHTVHDSDVRKDHRKLDGQIFAWEYPPVADEKTGARANPGCIYRCRCWAEPIL